MAGILFFFSFNAFLELNKMERYFYIIKSVSSFILCGGWLLIERNEQKRKKSDRNSFTGKEIMVIEVVHSLCWTKVNRTSF